MKNKQKTEGFVTLSECNGNTVSNLQGGTTSNTLYYQTIPSKTKTKTKTKTVDVYKITKKGKEILVGRNIITITKTKYNNDFGIPNYTLTTSTDENFTGSNDNRLIGGCGCECTNTTSNKCHE